MSVSLVSSSNSEQFRITRQPTIDSRILTLALRSIAMLALVFTLCQGVGAKAQTPQGNEFRLNTPTAGSQSAPQLTRLDNGNIFGAWSSPDGDGTGVFANIFNPSGTPTRSEFMVNEGTTRQQGTSSLTTLLNGNVLISWLDFRSGSGGEIYARVFTPSGSPQLSETQVTYTPPQTSRIDIVALSTGNAAAVWARYNSNNTWDIRGKILNSNAGDVTPEFAVSLDQTGDKEIPRVGDLSNGFMAAWSSDGQDPDGSFGVYARHFDNNGNPTSDEFRLNNYTLGDQKNVALATFRDDRIVAVWESENQDGSLKGIYTQFLHKNGTKIGLERQVNTFFTSSQQEPMVAVLNSDLCVAVWSSNNQDGDRHGIFGQMLDGLGEPVGREFQVNNYTLSEQMRPDVLRLSNTTFAVAWMSNAQGGPEWEVFARIFNTTVLPPITTGTTGSTGSTGTTGSTGSTGAPGPLQTSGTTAFVSPTSTTATAVSAGSSSAEADLTWLWVVLGVGGCLIPGGVSAYFVLRKREEESSTTSVAAAVPVAAKDDSTDSGSDTYDELPIAPASNTGHYVDMPAPEQARDMAAAAKGNYKSVKMPKN